MGDVLTLTVFPQGPVFAYSIDFTHNGSPWHAEGTTPEFEQAIDAAMDYFQEVTQE